MHEEYYAHQSTAGKELLEDHLRLVGRLARKFGDEFGSGKVAEQMGLIHDLGKHTEKFQEVLEHKRYRIDHAIVGAEIYADDDNYENTVEDQFIWILICEAVRDHHSYLDTVVGYPCFDDNGEAYLNDADNFFPVPDSFEHAKLITKDEGKENALSGLSEYQSICQYAMDQKLYVNILETDYLPYQKMNQSGRLLYARMLFSCLVDADYSGTASFEDPDVLNQVMDQKLDTERLRLNLEEYHNRLIKGTDPEKGINRLRNIVYQDCTLAGRNSDIGIYTLTAPTGTAKTLALISFALEQAHRNNQKRIFIVLPYLSIITQNANIYREALGAEIVMEDDSQTEYTDESRIYTDRWNAPVIVTTTVKFFQTLMGAKASDLRKLHSVANSVVVFDESQTLPAGLTDITMETLEALAEYFHTTVLLSTATQPTYSYRKALKSFKVKEIINDTRLLYEEYNKIKNTTVQFDTSQTWTVEDLFNYFEGQNQVMWVFNTTKKALEMYEYLTTLDMYDEDCIFLLTSRLCSEHKLDIIKEIKDRLNADLPCFLCSTQCIEAGVDIDFPCGAREYSPFSSIVQTAGRINRNGNRTGKMLVFRHEKSSRHDYPGTDYMNQANISYSMAESRNINVNSLHDIDEYFKWLYSGDSANGHDYDDLVKAKENFDSKGVDDNYKLIEDRNQLTILVPYQKEIEKYDVFEKTVRDNKYIIRKSNMIKCRKFSVTVFASSEVKEFIQRHCHNLALYTHYGRLSTNWYIADIDDIYDNKKGLITSEETGGLFI